MNNLRPSQIVSILGAVILLFSTFIEWADDLRGFSFDNWWGLFVFLMAIAAMAFAIIPLTGNKLPDEIIGFTPSQMTVWFGLASTIITAAFLFSYGGEGAKFGATLAFLAAVALLVGGFLGMRDGGAPMAAAAPQGYGVPQAGMPPAGSPAPPMNTPPPVQPPPAAPQPPAAPPVQPPPAAPQPPAAPPVQPPPAAPQPPAAPPVQPPPAVPQPPAAPPAQPPASPPPPPGGQPPPPGGPTAF